MESVQRSREAAAARQQTDTITEIMRSPTVRGELQPLPSLHTAPREAKATADASGRNGKESSADDATAQQPGSGVNSASEAAEVALMSELSRAAESVLLTTDGSSASIGNAAKVVSSCGLAARVRPAVLAASIG